MATSIAMPQLGESVTEGTVGRWLKAIGDRVEKDEPLVEVVTDKVNVEVPSPEAGYLVRIVVEEGQTVPVGTEIALLDTQPASGPAGAAGAGAASAPAPVTPGAEVAGGADSPAQSGAADARPARAAGAPASAAATAVAEPDADG